MRKVASGMLLVGLVSGVTAFAQSTAATKGSPTSAAVTITLTSKPNPPTMGDNEFVVTAKDAKGQPIAGADVSVLFVMPAMPAMKMAEMRNEVKLKAGPAAGTYQATGQVMMAGQWNVTVTVKKDGKALATKKLTLTAK